MNLKDAIENMLAADPNNPAEVRAAQSELRQALPLVYEVPITPASEQQS